MLNFCSGKTTLRMILRKMMRIIKNRKNLGGNFGDDSIRKYVVFLTALCWHEPI